MIMEDQHMTQQLFADFLQQSPATVSSIFNGRTKPTLNIIEAIKMKIPDISVDWLIWGTGQMHTSPSQSPDTPSLPSQGSVVEPVINFDSPSSPVVHSHSETSRGYGPQDGVNNTRSDYSRNDAKYFDKTPRKVTEIRVYYDDQTYETFIPSKK